MSIEELLRADADETKPCEDEKIALELLRPHISKAAIAAKRRKSQRRERRIFLTAMALFALIAAFACSALLRGDSGQARLMFICFGVFSVCALLLLPILERFLPARRRG